MIDDKIFADLVKEQISQQVAGYLETLLSDTSWQQQFETSIAKYIEARISAKFVNAAQVPGLVDSIKQRVDELFASGGVPGIESYVDSAVIQNAVDNGTQQLVKDTIEQLSIDDDWVKKIESQVVSEMTGKVTRHFSKTDVDALIVSRIDHSVGQWRERLAEQHRGINDQATTAQLTIMDDAVVITSGVTAQQLLVEQDTQVSGTLYVNKLVLRESVNTDTHAWDELVTRSAEAVKDQLGQEWRNSLVEQTIQLAKTSGIDFDQITLAGKPLVTGHTLNEHITHTNIRKTGPLEDLKVSGAVSFANQALTAGLKRVGVNTSEPDMALSVWDEETVISLGKISQDVAYIGTSRKHDLAIGIDRRAQIRLDTNGLTTVSQLRVDKWRIQHHSSTPGWSGTRGDLVLNNDVKDDLVFAWVCLGGFRWQPLKSA
jgi:hypothetical protein